MTCDLRIARQRVLLPLLTGGDENRFREALQLLLNAAMVLERQQHLRAAPFERTDERNGHANGFKDKAFRTRLGQLDLRVSHTCERVPQVRIARSRSIPRAWKKGCVPNGHSKLL